MSPRILLLLLLLSVSGCHNATAPSFVPGPYTIVGRVMDYETGATLPNVALKFGSQALTTSANGVYQVVVDRGDYDTFDSANKYLGTVVVTSPSTSGDLFFYSPTGRCASRYGMVTDASNGRPVAGASVGKVTTDSKGWWREDYGCGGCGICSTTFLRVNAQGYVEQQRLLGRGVQGVERLDFQLVRQ